MSVALAFVPITDAEASFTISKIQIPGFEEFYVYFDVKYALL